jgi:two-component system, NtrC family, response regulator
MSVSLQSFAPPAKLLIVDDDPVILSQLSLALSDEYSVFTAERPRQAWDVVVREHPDLVTLDLAIEHNDPESGFALLERCREFDPMMKVILITGNDGREHALRAVDHGAFDFFAKPVNLDELAVLLRRALHVGRLERENAAQEMPLKSSEHRLGNLLGRSAQMHEVFHLIRRVASADVAVLILGESGTGKELVARELRRLSRRAGRPFVSINCGAIPENLLESELFGHEKGSFTGAHVSRPGKLEVANSGIVFLDEIGELPIALQVKLLRFLQEHEIERVGGRHLIRLDVRVIAATNRDLSQEVKEGRFREDLYYRLSVVNINVPPLRERREDILYLAQFFLHRYCTELQRGNISFSRRARQALLRYDWPGNIRELEHHVQRAILLSNGRLVRAADLGLGTDDWLEPISLRKVREETDRQAIVEALRRNGGNISKAAQELQISRPSLHDLIRKHGVDTTTFKTTGTVTPAEGG